MRQSIIFFLFILFSALSILGCGSGVGNTNVAVNINEFNNYCSEQESNSEAIEELQQNPENESQPQYGSLSGCVIDNDTAFPISDVFIKIMKDSEQESTYSSQDGSFTFNKLNAGIWSLTVEKSGYNLAESPNNLTYEVVSNENTILLPIQLLKENSLLKGILKGYPVNKITGLPINKFKITQETPNTQIKSYIFNTAKEFKESGWTGLEIGNHSYSITATNYDTWYSNVKNPDGITLSKAETNLGIIEMTPTGLLISGKISGLQQYVIDNYAQIAICAESDGKVIASYTTFESDYSNGIITYILENVPFTARNVSIKCKVIGYKSILAKPITNLTDKNIGIIKDIDFDFTGMEVKKTNLKIIVRSSEPDNEDPMGTFGPGEVARVYVQTGSTNVAYADVTSVNYGGEVTISGVITGYPLKVIAVNQNRKYCSVTSEDITIPEDQKNYDIELTIAKD